MACFLVPAAEAVVVTVATKYLEKKNGMDKTQMRDESGVLAEEKIPFTRKLHWLTSLLWGGVVLLAFEHLWHGEVIPWFPFLTAAGNAADTAAMLHEMSTAGVAMAILVTAVWGVMVGVTGLITRRSPEAQLSAQ